ncbi:hypothetical protein [Actinacidiphila glaucinigra]|uniref:hypothetical protein n=1 Tax=Actinacidiphila glaucinigra TaxID=235986 RepID=UPI001FE5674B|nr:hypothetical protein [Actinacidiphila glaucinigra]
MAPDLPPVPDRPSPRAPRTTTADEGRAAPLHRLAAHRQRSGSSAVDLSEPPTPPALRRLAPELGLHTADLFVIAGVDVPGDLAPVDPSAGRHNPRLVRAVLVLPPRQRTVLRRYAAALPQQERPAPAPGPPAHERYPDGPGALLMRLVRNRNLGWTATAMTFLLLTGRYWSAATYGRVARGTVPLTAELLADFCAVLDVPADDLAAVTGVALPGPDTSPTANAGTAGVAELIWDVRRLTESRLRAVTDLAEAMRR